jgi:hypothetical protein
VLSICQFVPSQIKTADSFCCNVKVLPGPKFVGVSVTVPAPETTSVFICPIALPSGKSFALAVPDVNSVNGTLTETSVVSFLVS